jgi:hypothetical protein
MISDLLFSKGRTVGVTSPGSQTHMVLGFLLIKSGVKPDEVKIIGAGGNTMPLAIEKDSVQAGMMADPFFTVVTKQGKGYVLVDMFTAKGTLGRPWGRGAEDDAADPPGRDRQETGHGSEDGERAGQGQQVHHVVVRRGARQIASQRAGR